MVDAAEQMRDKRGPYYVKYLQNTRAGFERKLRELEAEILSLAKEGDDANQVS
jgi:hypothetical protein